MARQVQSELRAESVALEEAIEVAETKLMQCQQGVTLYFTLSHALSLCLTLCLTLYFTLSHAIFLSVSRSVTLSLHGSQGPSKLRRKAA